MFWRNSFGLKGCIELTHARHPKLLFTIGSS
uniref:Uncharacterized protein n=1 Tax=Arundo donax TaxID=35708 RepID=A0A0A9BIE2_ARUDO